MSKITHASLSDERESDKDKAHRFNLTLPDAVFRDIEKLANEGGYKITDVVRACIKMGIVAHLVDKDPNRQLIIRDIAENTETQIMMIY